MHVEERQARLEPELQCKSEESDKAHRSVPTCCLDPLESKLGFSHMSNFSQSAERAARAVPKGVKKGATFLLVFRCLNHTASSQKAFNGFQKGQVHSKKHKPSKKYFCGRSTPGSPPASLKSWVNMDQHQKGDAGEGGGGGGRGQNSHGRRKLLQERDLFRWVNKSIAKLVWPDITRPVCYRGRDNAKSQL